jgi:iron complex outermembrane receptor protein
VGAAYAKAFVAESLSNPYTVGDDLSNAPRTSGTLWTRYNIPSGFFRGLGAGMGIIYVGKEWGGDPTSTAYFIIPGEQRKITLSVETRF